MQAGKPIFIADYYLSHAPKKNVNDLLMRCGRQPTHDPEVARQTLAEVIQKRDSTAEQALKYIAKDHPDKDLIMEACGDDHVNASGNEEKEPKKGVKEEKKEKGEESSMQQAMPLLMTVTIIGGIYLIARQ